MAVNIFNVWDSMSPEMHEVSCRDLYVTNYRQEILEEPVPWIGMYTATASLFCTLAICGDLLKGIRHRRFWLPCKFFSLNAFSLSMLAVILKLTMDFSNTKLGYTDAFASVTTLVFMSIAISNFMTSVGSMDDSGIISNLTALVVLVVTTAVNIFLHKNQVDKIATVGYNLMVEQVVVTIFLVILLIPFCSLGLVVDTIKQELDFKFREMHKKVKSERLGGKRVALDELKLVLKKYWVMAETGSMQFVIARSAICVFPSLVCLLMALTCLEAAYRMDLLENRGDISSSYKWSIIYIICAQIIGITIGIISPLSRWFIAAKIRRSLLSRRSLIDELKMETYWTRRLEGWRESRIPSQIHSHRWKKVLHVSQRTVLNLCIKIQIIIVLISKLVLILSVCLQAVIFMFICRIVKLLTYPFRTRSSSDCREFESPDLSQYILLLEGELELPKDTIENICRGFDSKIKRDLGIEYKHRELVDLLRMSSNFKGVRDFDSNKVTSLHYQDPPNCWSLPLVTLACLVQAVPHNIRSLKSPLHGLRDAIDLVKLVEETLATNAELLTLTKVADIVWDALELDGKWQGMAIKDTGDCSYRATLCKFSGLAIGKITDFKCSVAYASMGNPLDWPPEIIAANSMYRICGTLLSAGDQTDEQMFTRLAIIIADILAACLTNLPLAIIVQCDRSIIEKKEASVQHAAGLIYEVSEILELLEQRKWPDQLDPNEAGCIDAWRADLEQGENGNPAMFVSATDNRSIPGVTGNPESESLLIRLCSSFAKGKMH